MFILERRDSLVLQGELQLQGPIGHPASALEGSDNLVEPFVKLYYRFSCNTVSNALASWRSAVSKPSVNQL
jgi:hypothetical protein